MGISSAISARRDRALRVQDDDADEAAADALAAWWLGSDVSSA
jgi:hypothetical protein